MAEALRGFDDGEAFTIRTVLQGLRNWRSLRVGPPGPIPPAMAERLVRNPGRGVFLDGATPEQARQWAQRIAQTIPGARVVHDERNTHEGGNLPHFHIALPRNEWGEEPRMAHIFYGAAPPPSREFFDH
jgi:hypothetical protein